MATCTCGHFSTTSRDQPAAIEIDRQGKIDRLVNSEGAPRHMSIQMRKFGQRQRYRAGDEGKISERRSLALFPRFLERAARRLDARKIDLDGLQHMSAGRLGTHHVFGDPFA